MLARYPIDPTRVGHTGHSYGGFMTNWLITQYPDRFAAAITGAGITQLGERLRHGGHLSHEGDRVLRHAVGPGRARPHDQAVAAHATPGRVKTPTLFIHGEVDQRVPYEEGEQMYFALRRRGVPAKMIQYAGQPHGIGGHWNNVHRMLNELKWWNRYLGPPSPAGPLTRRRRRSLS